MAVYFLLLVYLFVVALMFRENKRLFLIATFLGLFVIMGFRDGTTVGEDSASSYFIIFIRSDLFTLKDSNDNFLFCYFMKIIYKIFKVKIGLRNSKAYQIFIILVAAFVCYAYYRLLLKYSNKPFVSVMWFMGMLIYFFLFSALKQAMAMAVLCFSFDALIERKKLKFFVTVALAASFHFPALVFLPAWWIAKIRMGKWYLFLLLATMIFTFAFRSQILKFMMPIYYEEGLSEKALEGITFLGNKVVIMILVLLIAVILRKPDYNSDRLYTILFYFMGIAIVFQSYCYYSNIFERLADYYYHLSIIFVPMLFENTQQRKTFLVPSTQQIFNVSGPIVIFVFALFRTMEHVSSATSRLSPFLFFWQK